MRVNGRRLLSRHHTAEGSSNEMLQQASFGFVLDQTNIDIPFVLLVVSDTASKHANHPP